MKAAAMAKLRVIRRALVASVTRLQESSTTLADFLSRAHLIVSVRGGWYDSGNSYLAAAPGLAQVLSPRQNANLTRFLMMKRLYRCVLVYVPATRRI